MKFKNYWMNTDYSIPENNGGQRPCSLQTLAGVDGSARSMLVPDPYGRITPPLQPGIQAADIEGPLPVAIDRLEIPSTLWYVDVTNGMLAVAQSFSVAEDYSMSNYLSTLLFGGWDVWAGVFPTAEEFNEAVNAQFVEQENYLRGLMGLDAISGTGELAYHYDASAWLEEQLQWFAPLPSLDDPWDWPSDGDAGESDDTTDSGDATGDGDADGGTNGDAGDSGDFDADDPWDVPFNSPDAAVGERDEQVGVESRPADGKTPVQPVIS